MKIKGQTFNTFQRFIYQAEYQSKKKLNHLCTNFGKKFANKAFEEYTSKEGIKWGPNLLSIS